MDCVLNWSWFSRMLLVQPNWRESLWEWRMQGCVYRKANCSKAASWGVSSGSSVITSQDRLSLQFHRRPKRSQSSDPLKRYVMSVGTGETQSSEDCCVESRCVGRANMKSSEKHPELDSSRWKLKKINLKPYLRSLRQLNVDFSGKRWWSKLPPEKLMSMWAYALGQLWRNFRFG